MPDVFMIRPRAEAPVGCGAESKTRTMVCIAGVKGCPFVFESATAVAHSPLSLAEENANVRSVGLLGNFCGRMSGDGLKTLKHFSADGIVIGKHSIDEDEVYRICSEEEMCMLRIYAEQANGELTRVPLFPL